MTDDAMIDQLFGDRPSFRERVSRPGAAGSPAETAEQHAGSGVYKAYGYLPVGKVVESCEITWWMPMTEVPAGMDVQYRFLTRIGFIGDSVLHLMLTDCVVKIEGRNLRELRKKLANRQVTYVQTFNAHVHGASPSEAEPMVTNITILYGRNAEQSADAN